MSIKSSNHTETQGTSRSNPPCIPFDTYLQGGSLGIDGLCGGLNIRGHGARFVGGLGDGDRRGSCGLGRHGGGVEGQSAGEEQDNLINSSRVKM
ncbi:hypothetical protein E2C01_076898 [Portunus trituberculatus]|uniref:Uncharacterized protein n=1 Tax=Portunus trituberculatus TaxID=210409 RepID=A0A5B7IPW3_PORTR|nr:hypothetical protein [Portunus trituberculatus]